MNLPVLPTTHVRDLRILNLYQHFQQCRMEARDALLRGFPSAARLWGRNARSWWQQLCRVLETPAA